MRSLCEFRACSANTDAAGNMGDEGAARPRCRIAPACRPSIIGIVFVTECGRTDPEYVIRRDRAVSKWHIPIPATATESSCLGRSPKRQRRRQARQVGRGSPAFQHYRCIGTPKPWGRCSSRLTQRSRDFRGVENRWSASSGRATGRSGGDISGTAISSWCAMIMSTSRIAFEEVSIMGRRADGSKVGRRHAGTAYHRAAWRNAQVRRAAEVDHADHARLGVSQLTAPARRGKRR